MQQRDKDTDIKTRTRYRGEMIYKIDGYELKAESKLIAALVWPNRMNDCKVMVG